MTLKDLRDIGISEHGSQRGAKLTVLYPTLPTVTDIDKVLLSLGIEEVGDRQREVSAINIMIMKGDSLTGLL